MQSLTALTKKAKNVSSEQIRVLNQECTKSSWQIYRNCDIFKEVEVMKDAGNINVLWNFDKNELER